MQTVTIGGLKTSVDIKNMLGKGMEADVYRIDKVALKLFKNSSHPDLLTQADRDSARKKIQEHQQKLRQFPKNLPQHVVVPLDLAYSCTDGKIVGYTMRLVDNAKQARVFGQISERSKGIDPNQIVDFFLDLHETVRGLHSRKVVIGDFNDLNVLVSGNEAHVIDADSFQFENFPCRMYTEEFVDPRLCDPNKSSPVLSALHDPDSDWYAYTTMLFKLLLCVGPFGGVYKPSNHKDIVLHTERVLKGISVFNPAVVYPRKAIPFGVLSDEILDHFQSTF
jgi:H/ACA ribonucleoprotein complex subunit 3